MKGLPFLRKMGFFRKKDKRREHDTFGNSNGNGHISFKSASLPGWAGGRNNSLNSPPPADGGFFPGQHPQYPLPTAASARALARLPPRVLERVFTFVCPHSRDQSYETCEESALEDACMLCDMRDLAHCAAVSRQWRKEALMLLYHSIRIDNVHYCDREIYLSEKRKRRSFFDRNGDPEDTAQARLKLLCRTLREDAARLGPHVQFLKTPYMLRESCQADLARTIAVLPRLRYVDLPEGLFMDDPSYVTLRLEVQARCHDLRKMTYMAGSEKSLEALARGTIWTNLEVLELIKINMDPAVLRRVLGTLGNLRALKVSEMQVFTDGVLGWGDMDGWNEVLGGNEMLPPFPALEEFILNKVPNVTADGIKAYLNRPDTSHALRVLTLTSTGVEPWRVQEILAAAPSLTHLSIIDTVITPLTAFSDNVPPLVSNSLLTLHYEITPHHSAAAFSSTTSSYYNYLARSLLSGGLPNLRALYVREPRFPDLLLGLPPPVPPFAEGAVSRPYSSGSSSAFSSPLSSSFSPTSHLSPMHSPGFSPTTGGPQGKSLNPFHTGQPGQPFRPPAAPNPNSRFSSNNPFASLTPTATGAASITNLPRMLEVFTKGDDEPDWSFVKVKPGSPLPSKSGSNPGGRPLSSYGLGADVMGGSVTGWSSGAGARRSVMVGNPAGGGFLAVPTEARGGRGARDEQEEEWPRPVSSAGEKRRKDFDLWR